MVKNFTYRARKRKPPPPPPAADPLSEEESFDEEDDETLGRKRKTEEKLPKPGKRVRLQPSGGLQYKKRKQTTPPTSRKSASSQGTPTPQIRRTPRSTSSSSSSSSSSTPKTTPRSSKPTTSTPKSKTPSKSSRAPKINVSDMLREYASTVEPKSKKSGPLVKSFLQKFIEEFEDEFETFQRQDRRLQKRKREFEENERKILIHQQKEKIKRLKDETQRIRAKIQDWEDLQRSQIADLSRWGGSDSGVQSFEDYRQILSQPDFRYIEVNKIVPSLAAKPSPIDPLGLSTDRKTDTEKALESFHTKVLRLGTFLTCLQNFGATAGSICNEESKKLRDRSFAPYNSAPGTSSLLQAVANAK